MMRAFGHIALSDGRRGMLSDIRETPQVFQRLIDKHLQDGGGGTTNGSSDASGGKGGGYGCGGAPPVATEAVSAAAGDIAHGAIRLPELQKPFPEGHRFAGRSPLEIMAGASSGPSAGFKNKFSIIGSGTSYHTALLAEYLIETIARIRVDVQYASEFRYRERPIMEPGDIFVVVSNSGETFDALESLRMVQRCPMGPEVLTIGVVSEAESSIARETDAFLDVLAGQEDGVAATKAFSGAILGFVLLAVALGQACGTLTECDRSSLLEKVRELPALAQRVIDRESVPRTQDGVDWTPNIGERRLWDISCQNVLAQNFIFLGRGFNFPIALEGAMKCKEVSYIHAEGYPAAEMKHGPIALIDQFMPVVFIAPQSDPTYEKIKANIEEVRARRGAVIVITEDQNEELDALCEYVIHVPATHEWLMPLLAVLPLQLLALMMGTLRGNEVDHPRGLLKTVCTDGTVVGDAGKSA